MPRLRLVNVGLPYKKIMQGHKWIGRVYKNAQGGYIGTIGKGASRFEASGATEQQAFGEVCARYFGQPDLAGLQQHNREVRAHNRAVRGTRPRVNSMDDVLNSLYRMLEGGHRPSMGTPAGERLRGEMETQRAIEEQFGEDDFTPHTSRRRH